MVDVAFIFRMGRGGGGEEEEAEEVEKGEEEVEKGEEEARGYVKRDINVINTTPTRNALTCEEYCLGEVLAAFLVS